MSTALGPGAAFLASHASSVNVGSASPDLRRPEAIDRGWIATALRAAGGDTTVADVVATPVGTGQTGDCVRLRIEYATADGPGPRSLIGKFPSDNPASFRAGMAGGEYQREVKFYRDLAARSHVSAPTCYLAALDEESGNFVLLLEDLAPARQGDQLHAPTIKEAGLVVEEAAKLHAAWWDDPAIGEQHRTMLDPPAFAVIDGDVADQCRHARIGVIGRGEGIVIIALALPRRRRRLW